MPVAISWALRDAFSCGAGEEDEWLWGEDLSKGGANKEVGDGHSGPETGASISVDLAPRAFMPGTAVVTE